MQAFLKKAVIGVVCLLLVVALFWRTLTASAFWGLTIMQTWGASTIQTTPSAPLVLPSASSTASSTAFGTLLIPQVFANTQVLQQSETLTIFNDQTSNDRYLVAPIATFTANLVANSSPDDVERLCSALGQTFTGDPCTSDKEYLDAVMTVSNKTAGLFSSSAKKTAAGTFIVFKSAYLPANTTIISPLNTDVFSGYLAQAPDRSIAYIFDQAGTGYEITFVNMEQSRIETILASITANSTQ